MTIPEPVQLGLTLAEILPEKDRRAAGRRSVLDSEPITAAVEEPDMPWSVVEGGGDCPADKPWAVVKDDDGEVEGCHASQEEAQQQVEALYADEEEEDADVEASAMTFEVSSNTVGWEGTLVVEGSATGDGREFAPGSLTWGELPMPLGWKQTRAHGGVDMGGVYNIGRIDTIERVGNEIKATGVIDVGSPEGAEVARRMGTREMPGFLSGVSIDADDPERADVEYVWAEGCDELSEDAPMEEWIPCMVPEKEIYHSGRIRAATLCDIPAFVEAQLYLTASLASAPARFRLVDPRPVQSTRLEVQEMDTPSMADVVEELTAAAHMIVLQDVPPSDWFTMPNEDPEIGAITVTDSGRIFGYLAPKGVAHRGFQDKRVTVPTGNVDYSRWMNRPTIVAGGQRIATGPITMDCGHASVRPGVGSQPALDHYDNACSVVATARIGENAKGVWIAGALLPGVSESQIARMLACQLSGDWRPHRERRGHREFCGALLVPVPGFPVANRKMSVRLDHGQLVASAVPVSFLENDGQPTRSSDPRILLAAGILAEKVGRDRRSRAAEMANKIHKG